MVARGSRARAYRLERVGSRAPFTAPGPESITGCSIIEAESLDEAEKIAQKNPFIASIRVYEVRAH